MVLVSSPKSVIQRVNHWNGPVENKKGRPLHVGLPGLGVSVSCDQLEVRTPKAFALATDCVRLWTPSLP